IWGHADARNHICRRERSLFDFSKEVLWIAVQLHGTHLDAWVICLRDGLGQVEDVVTVGLGIFVWNDLNVELPGWIVATRNRLVEITTVMFGVDTGHSLGFFIREVFQALVCQEVETYPEAFAFVIDPHVGVRAVAIDCASCVWYAAWAQQRGDLVGCFRVPGPEARVHAVIAQAICWQALLGPDEVWELDGVAYEEDGGVLSHQARVSFWRAELQ